MASLADGHHRRTVSDSTISEARTQLDAEPASAGEARRFLTATVEGWGKPQLAERGALVIDELTTNAILHALGPIDIVVRLEDTQLVVEVHDRDPRLPTPTARPPDAALAFGRGLHMVEALSTAWGSRPTEFGKVVWANIRVGP